MHRVLFGGDHFARPRHGPASCGPTAPLACKRISAAKVAASTGCARRAGVLKALDLSSCCASTPLPTKRVHCARTPHHGVVGLKRVLQAASASKQSTAEASDHATHPTAPTSKCTGASKKAPAAVQKSPSPINEGDRLTGNRRSGVLGVLNYWQATASPSSTSKGTAASCTSKHAASASSHSSGRAAVTAGVKPSVRAARRAIGTCADSRASLSDLVGSVAESQAEHKARHPQFHPGCSRCIYYALRAGWERGHGCHRHQAAGGNEVRTVWLAPRPATLGGVWGLGCVFCAAYMARRAENATASPCTNANRKQGQMGSRRSWARFDVRKLSQMGSRAVRQHADTMTHRLAARAYFLPDRNSTLILIDTRNLFR